MNKEKIILILVTIILLTGACSKKEKEYPTYYLGQEYKDYVVYKVGSYWIYQDSASKMIDSIYQYQNVTRIVGGKKDGFKGEMLDNNKYTSLYNDTLLCGGGIVSEMGLSVYRTARLKDYFNSNIDYFEGDIGQLAPGTFNTYYIEKKDSIEFNSQNYFSVEIFENKQQEYSYQPKKTYYAKHVGLIRKELFNGQVWNLIRYNVSQ